MALCGKCGAEMADGVKICPACGAEAEASASEAPKTESAANKIAGINNTADSTADYDAQDIADNKIMAVLAYFGLLFLIPLLAAPKSKFARFHANQGIVLCIVLVGYGIVNVILTIILGAIFLSTWNSAMWGIYSFLTIILSLVWIIPGILAILGIYNAATGKAKELPIIGKFKILK